LRVSQSHKAEIIKRFANAYRACEQKYDEANREVIETVRDWPQGFGTTYRRNGQIVVGSTRDIVDTGELRDSQSYQRVDEYRTEYSWSADHALLVHEGYTTKTGKRIPARRWTEVAAEELNIPQVFCEAFNND
jgi:hypothetical protein